MEYNLASTSWDHNEINTLYDVIEKGVFTMGENVKNFEDEFAKKFNSRFAVMVNSGSSANLLMIAALFYHKNDDFKLRSGDEVIVPSVSWSTTYMPLQQYGLKVKFVDIDKETLNYDLSALHEAITNKTKVIFSVNLLGNSNDFRQIKILTEKHNLIHILDNCESMGSKFENKYTGEFALMSSYSTFFSHHISTMEGGMILTDNEELFHILLSLRAHGWTRNLPAKNFVTGIKSDDIFEESFKFVLPGYNLRPLELSGALGIEQLKKLDGLIEVRRENAKYFVEKFSRIQKVYIQKEIGESSWFGFSIVLNESYNSTTRSKLLDKLMNAKIECRPIVAGNFVKNPVIHYFQYEVHGSLTNSDLIDNNGFFVGNHHYDIKPQIDLLHDIISETL